MTLGIRLGRRLLAVTAFADERFEFHDSRFVPSRKASLTTGVSGYFRRVFDQARPTAVYYFAPTGPNTVTDGLIRLLEAEAAAHGVAVKRLTRSDIFDTFGAAPLRTRQALRDQMHQLWPGLREVANGRQLVMAEAAAVALVGDLYQEWPPG
jgi:hypothetical protein